MIRSPRISPGLWHIRLRRQMKDRVRPGRFDKNASLFRLAQIGGEGLNTLNHLCPIGLSNDRSPNFPTRLSQDRFGQVPTDKTRHTSDQCPQATIPRDRFLRQLYWISKLVAKAPPISLI